MAEPPTEPTLLAISCSEIAASIVLLDAGTERVLQQPTITLPLAPTVETDQATAKTVCRNWRNVYRLQSTGVLTTLGATANYVSSIASKINGLSSNENIESGIKLVQRNLDRSIQTIQSTKESLEVDFLRLELEKDIARFDSDANQVAREYEGTDGELAQIRQQITQLEQKVTNDNKELAKGATEVVAKALAAELVIGITIGLGAITLPAAAAGAPELTVLMYKSFAGAVKAGTGAVAKKAQASLLENMKGVNIESSIAELAAYVTAEERLESALKAFGVVASQLADMEATGNDLVASMQALEQEMKSIRNQLDLILVKCTSGVDLQEIKDDVLKFEAQFYALESTVSNLNRSVGNNFAVYE